MLGAISSPDRSDALTAAELKRFHRDGLVGPFALCPPGVMDELRDQFAAILAPDTRDINEINLKPFFGNYPITRPYVRPVLENLMQGSDGRIPVMVFVGNDEAWAAALAEQAKAAKMGASWIVTDPRRTLLSDGSELHFTVSGLAARARR